MQAPGGSASAEAIVHEALRLHREQRYPAARELLEAGIALHPSSAVLRLRLGDLLSESGHYEAAAAAYRDALELDPIHAIAHNNLGSVLLELGELAEAEAALQRALLFDPDLTTAHANLTDLYRRAGRQDLALAAEARRATSLVSSALPSEAIRLYEMALGRSPGDTATLNQLGLLHWRTGDVDRAVAAFESVLALDPRHAVAHSNLLLMLNYRELDGISMRKRHETWNVHSIPRMAASSRPRHDRVRIGYVSPDFNSHSVAHLFLPLLRSHDRDRFDVFLYGSSTRSDAVTAQIKGLTPWWRDVSKLPPEAIARRIRADEIDVAVDLAGHTGEHALRAFTARPAPVQVTYLGYPNTTGLTAIDYRITDAVADPPGETDAFHSESLVRLDEAFLCYEPVEEAPEIRPLPAERRESVTFASFNVLAKLSDAAVETWSAILTAVPRSRLMLKAATLDDPEIRRRVAKRFARHSISASQLELVGRSYRQVDHLAMYDEVDIALDPFPYNGTVTSLEAMWMGVPFVTLAGDRHAGRVGASLLTVLGLRSLIARQPEEYVEIAVATAREIASLAALRSSLRERLAASALMDGAALGRRIERAYLEMLA